MKTPEELSALKEEVEALKEEVEALNKKLHELTEEELEQVSGGHFVPVPTRAYADLLS